MIGRTIRLWNWILHATYVYVYGSVEQTGSFFHEYIVFTPGCLWISIVQVQSGTARVFVFSVEGVNYKLRFTFFV